MWKQWFYSYYNYTTIYYPEITVKGLTSLSIYRIQFIWKNFTILPISVPSTSGFLFKQHKNMQFISFIIFYLTQIFPTTFMYTFSTVSTQILFHIYANFTFLTTSSILYSMSYILSLLTLCYCLIFFFTFSVLNQAPFK